MPAKYKTVDEYLATLSREKRETLTTLRALLRKALPKAEEAISYSIAGF